MDYPIWDAGMSGGILMAVVAIAHVIVSHFAIGGGLVLVVTETIAVRRGDTAFRDLARRGSLMLVLVSTVFGAISGVGIWVVAGLISPGAISALIHNYVWGWAIEWTFFAVEIVAALIYYTSWDKISKAAHLAIGWTYFVAAYLSLVVINGILAFMLTPGRWLETRAFWDGFFNPGYVPALVLRTGICAMMATAFLLFVARKTAVDARPRVVRYLAGWLAAGAIVAYAGYRSWEAALPESVTALFRGEAPLIPSLASTRSLTLWALTAAFAVGGLLLLIVPRAARTMVVVIAAIAAFAFFGGYERLREGIRKPFVIHSHLFSNGLRVDDIARIDENGMAAYSGWVAASRDESPESYGREVFRAQCSSCHTLDGYRAIRPLLPTVADLLAVASDHPPGSGEAAFLAECASCHAELTYADMREMLPGVDDIRGDPEFVRDLNTGMIGAMLKRLHDMGAYYTEAERGVVMDPRATDYPHMPPLVGTDDDVAALVTYLASLDRPHERPLQMARRGGE